METFFDTLVEQWQADGSVDFGAFAVCMILAIAFGLALQMLYNFYFDVNEPQDGSLARSLVLLTPTLSATFWMIQSSLVLSLGLLGSLSFVRFRTPIKRSEDISFIVVAVTTSIACASGLYLVGVALVGLLFAYSAIRKLMQSGGLAQGRLAIVTFNTAGKASMHDITRALNEVEAKPEFVSSRTYDGITSFVFNARRLNEANHDALAAKLAGVDSNAQINIFYPTERLGA